MHTNIHLPRIPCDRQKDTTGLYEKQGANETGQTHPFLQFHPNPVQQLSVIQSESC